MATRSQGVGRVALCLSGGGFRAALFHLGALRRLNECGLLASVETISAVSGGSILAAHLADRVALDRARVFEDWDRFVAEPFRSFAGHNLRTPALARRLVPANWLRPEASVEGLAASLERRLTSRRLRDLAPGRPRFVFVATDMTHGCAWTFTRTRVGDAHVGYAPTPLSWSVGRAAAASSCFPPLFGPMPIGLAPDSLTGGLARGVADREARVRGVRLTDGGCYDNLGLEPVWKTHDVLLVSDGGALFRHESGTRLLWRLNRYTELLGNAALALRKRWLIASFVAGRKRGAYWGLGSRPDESDRSAGYSSPLVRSAIARVRTDLDAFTLAESAVLENHGYLACAAAVARHLPDLGGAASVRAPRPEWLDPDRAERALARSHERTLLGRTRGS